MASPPVPKKSPDLTLGQTIYALFIFIVAIIFFIFGTVVAFSPSQAEPGQLVETRIYGTILIGIAIIIAQNCSRSLEKYT